MQQWVHCKHRLGQLCYMYMCTIYPYFQFHSKPRARGGQLCRPSSLQLGSPSSPSTSDAYRAHTYSRMKEWYKAGQNIKACPHWFQHAFGWKLETDQATNLHAYMRPSTSLESSPLCPWERVPPAPAWSPSLSGQPAHSPSVQQNREENELFRKLLIIILGLP